MNWIFTTKHLSIINRCWKKSNCFPCRILETMKMGSEQIRDCIEFEVTQKKNSQRWNLTVWGKPVVKTQVDGNNTIKRRLLLLDMSISYFSFPATITLHA